jgi:hypothetical protein
MPEQISKYPDVTLQVLKESGARCGEGASQNILKQCPRILAAKPMSHSHNNSPAGTAAKFH